MTLPRGTESVGGLLALTTPGFHVLFNSLSKVLFTFPSQYLFAIGLPRIFSIPAGIRGLELQAQTALLVTFNSVDDTLKCGNGAVTLNGAQFHVTFRTEHALPLKSHPTFCQVPHVTLAIQSRAVPCSLAVTEGIVVTFFSSPY